MRELRQIVAELGQGEAELITDMPLGAKAARPAENATVATVKAEPKRRGPSEVEEL